MPRKKSPRKLKIEQLAAIDADRLAAIATAEQTYQATLVSLEDDRAAVSVLRQIFEDANSATTPRMQAFSELKALKERIEERQKIADSVKADSLARAERIAQDKREQLDPPETELGGILAGHQKMLRQETPEPESAAARPTQSQPKYRDGFISQWNQFGVTYRGVVEDLDGGEFLFDSILNFDALIAEPTDIAALQFRNVKFQVNGQEAFEVELQSGWAAGHAPVTRRERIPDDEPAPNIELPPVVDTPEPLPALSVPAEDELHKIPHWYDAI